MLIQQIFPEPIYISKLDRPLAKEELKIFNQHKKKTTKNIGNSRTTDSYVLEHKALKNLKKDLNKSVFEYFNKIICTSSPIIPYITQSWINYTETNQFHPSHSHSNSHISGVFYIAADKKIDRITFYKTPAHEPIKPKIVKHNIFNSTSWHFPIQTGDVLLFRSSLEHGVAKTKGFQTRISLSFNVFFKGTLGDKELLTELILK